MLFVASLKPRASGQQRWFWEVWSTSQALLDIVVASFVVSAVMIASSFYFHRSPLVFPLAAVPLVFLGLLFFF